MKKKLRMETEENRKLKDSHSLGRGGREEREEGKLRRWREGRSVKEERGKGKRRG